MGAKAQQFVPKGMKRDYSASKADPQYAYENHNIRITSRESNTLLSITNEKGNSPIVIDPPLKYVGIDISYIPGTSTTHVLATLQEEVLAKGVKIRIHYLDNADSEWKDSYIVFGTTSYPIYSASTFISKDAEQISTYLEYNHYGENIFYLANQEKPSPFQGVCVGTCVLNDYLILFLWDDPVSRIIRLESKGDTFAYKCLYEGSVKFDVKFPLDTLAIFENNDIQKVYWVDGLNPARVINIVEDIDLTSYKRDDSGYLDTARVVPGEVDIDVERVENGNGTFSSGTIQYAVTAYKEHATESGILAISPINYIAFSDRGANPEETVQTAFQIDVSHIDTLEYFEYLRIYSIHRTSKDATPVVKVLTDVPIEVTGSQGFVRYVDYGNTGYTVDPTLLLYLGATSITGNSLNQKDGTLFIGGYKILESYISEELKKEIKNKCTISFARRSTFIATGNNSSSTSPAKGYIYESSLKYPASEITTFKSREWYRFGVQLQYPSGKWSDVAWVGDARCNVTPAVVSGYLYMVEAHINMEYEFMRSLAKDFINIRPVVVYPQDSDREVIAQGILSPTVYSARDRFSNSPFVQSSWYFRGMKDRYQQISNEHNKRLFLSVDYGGEIQGTWDGSTPVTPYIPKGTRTGEKWSRSYPSAFYVDSSIVTFHSPDVEFDDNFSRWDNSSLKLRIIGVIPFDYSTRWNTLTTKNLGHNGKTAIENFTNYSGDFFGSEVNNTVNPWAGRWTDKMYNSDTSKDWTEDFPVYTWHRRGSLSNYGLGLGSQNEDAVLEKKIMSSLVYSDAPVFFSSAQIWDANGKVAEDSINGWKLTPDIDNATGITAIRTFNSEDVSMVKIPSPMYSNLPDLVYYGNVNSIMSDFGDGRDPSDPNYISEFSVYYPLTRFYLRSDETLYIYNSDQKDEGGNYNRNSGGVKTADPIEIYYKSTPHVVFGFNYNSKHQQRILPLWDESSGVGKGDKDSFPFWADAPIGVDWVAVERLITDPDSGLPEKVQGPGLYLAELYKDTNDTRFGGTSQEALENNTWVPCGEPVHLNNIVGRGLLKCPVGDTYFQRYDCLKTYPFNDTATNSVVEIASFLCETRINIDGRYDRNRGLINNTSVSPKNFNLLNWAYTQNDNFFSYRLVDSDEYSITEYPNSVIWSKTKIFGEEVDSWVDLPLTSVLDLDGDKGGIVSIQKLNNELYCIQPDGICRILYNSRSQMVTAESGNMSIPVELANTGKVEGKTYMTTSIGCSDRASIITTPSGIYFLDKDRNSLFMWGPQGITDLTDKFSFRTWVDQIDFSKNWDPVEHKGMKAFYDDTNGDVYFVTESPDTTVCYSELLGQFSSFYDYEKTQQMVSVNGGFYAVKNNAVWAQGAGEYNSFFGTKKPYSVEVICNMDEPVDKIFNTIEWRATVKENGEDSQSTFDTVEVSTDGEYQKTGKVSIENRTGVPTGGMMYSDKTTLRRKFRMWRIPIPRDSVNKRDRMRGPWAKIKLSKLKPASEKMELHDLIVHFFE